MSATARTEITELERS